MCRWAAWKGAWIFLFAAWICPGPVFGGEGRLSLVGMGPGDPDLATVRALGRLREADIVFTLSSDLLERFGAEFEGKDVRDLSGSGVTRHHARSDSNDAVAGKAPAPTEGGKTRGGLVREVKRALREGKKIVFVDSGDPLIYGPWVWLLGEFGDSGMEVVPGVSSFNAGLAALRRDPTWSPDTHTIILTTDRARSGDRLEELAAHRCSLVLFTHKTEFPEMMRKLTTRYPAATPVAVVFYAGYEGRESVVRGTLETIVPLMAGRDLPLEHIVFVGDFLDYRMGGER
ncbi:MAG: tetrapyrrole methylase [Acidobacteria bacterium]|nr:tetrapyrrole methylase [Acidobacteriota bacterium]